MQQLWVQKGIAEQQSIIATKQNVGGVALDWLRNYGQTTAMQAAGIGAPFSTIAGGFSIPFAKPTGAPQPAVVGANRI